MPTAAKLLAALAFACVAFFASEVFKPLLPEGTRTGNLSLINAGLGFIVGWLVMGKLAGKGYYRSIGSGFRTSATLLFFVLLAWSIWIMLVNSTRMRYDNAMEAIVAVFGLIYEYGAIFVVDPQSLVVLFVGGIAGGLLAEWAAQNFE